jgi:purine-binding chemotaxis protein CheW
MHAIHPEIDAAAAPMAPSAAPARHPAAPAPIHASGEFLSLRLGAEEYAIDILKVQEIRSYENPTRIANAPAFVKGVINLRGIIIPLVDLRLKFALARADYDAFTVVIVMNVAQRVVGAVVDAVNDVVELSADQILAAPTFNGRLDTSFITGIGAVQGRMLVLLDIDRLMASDELGLTSLSPG